MPQSVPQPVSCIPLYHPGRRDFPGPVGSEDLYPWSLPGVRGQFKRWRAFAAHASVCCTSRLVGVHLVLRTLCSGRSFLTRPSPPRAPLLWRRYPRACPRGRAAGDDVVAPPISRPDPMSGSRIGSLGRELTLTAARGPFDWDCEVVGRHASDSGRRGEHRGSVGASSTPGQVL